MLLTAQLAIRCLVASYCTRWRCNWVLTGWGTGGFSINLRASLFNKYLSNEPNFGRIHSLDNTCKVGIFRWYEINVYMSVYCNSDVFEKVKTRSREYRCTEQFHATFMLQKRSEFYADFGSAETGSKIAHKKIIDY